MDHSIIKTPRLDLVLATAAMARADADENRPAFADALGATITDEWPQEEMADAREPLAASLEEAEDQSEWGLWYIVLPRANDRVLIGGVGFYNEPDDDGCATFGYGVLPQFQRNGYASEAVNAILDWGFNHPEMQLARAHTFELHRPSIGVLEKNHFTFARFNPDDHEVPDSDRQGRGRLVDYELGRVTFLEHRT